MVGHGNVVVVVVVGVLVGNRYLGFWSFCSTYLGNLRSATPQRLPAMGFYFVLTYKNKIGFLLIF